jgi:hypothetical protein
MKTVNTIATSLLLVGLVTLSQDRQIGGVGITVFVDHNFLGKAQTFSQDVPPAKCHKVFFAPRSGARSLAGG